MSETINITNVLSKETTRLNIDTFSNKDDLFNKMVETMYEAGIVSDKKEYLDSLYFRESEGPTCMGNGIAIPHGKSDAVNKPMVLITKTNEKFIYESFGESDEVDLVFMLAIPGHDETNLHLRMLAALARKLVNKEVVDSIRSAKTFEEVIKAFEKADD